MGYLIFFRGKIGKRHWKVAKSISLSTAVVSLYISLIPLIHRKLTSTIKKKIKKEEYRE